MQIEIQQTRELSAERSLSHKKTWSEPLFRLRNARRPKQNDTATPSEGIPALVVRRKIGGIAHVERECVSACSREVPTL